MAIDLEKLNIVIASDATKATGAIDTLIIKLNGLKWSLGRLGDVSGNVGSVFKGIASSTNAVVSQVDDLNDALNGTTRAGERTAKAADDVAEAEEDVAEAADEAAEKLRRQNANFKEAKDAVSRYYNILGKIKTMKSDIFEDDQGTFSSESGKWDSLANAANRAATHYERIDDLMQDMGDDQAQEVLQRQIRAEEDYNIKLEKVDNSTKAVSQSSKGASGSLKELGKTAANTSGHFSKLLGTIKRVAMMRLIRWAIRQLVNTAKEGLEILVEWDETFGNNTSYAAKTVEELSDKWNEVRKSVGAAIMPLIQILQPIINLILNGVIAIVNAFNQILRSAQGFSDYMKATYVNTSRATKEAKELRRVLFGFDELNVLNGSGGTGAAGSVSPIEYDPTPIEGAFKRIGETARKVWDGIKKTSSEVWDAMKPNLERAWDGVIRTINGIKNGDWAEVWAGLLQTVDGVWNAIVDGASVLWDKVSPYLTPIVDWVVNNILSPIKTEVDEWATQFATDHPFLAKLLGIKDTSDRKEKFKEFGIKFSATTNQDNKTTALESLVDAGTKAGTLGINLMTKTKLDNTIKQVIGLVGSNLISMGMSISLGKFASGGDPEMGTLFWAGENGGAEVVATSPSGTGVMNMKQMQDAVSSGNVQVVNAIGAMTNILASAINNKDTNAYLDGQMITDNVLRRANGMARATGQPVLVR